MHDIKYKPKRGRVRRASPEMAAYVRQIAADNAGEHSRLKRNLIRAIREELTDRQRTVLRLRFGMDDGISRSLEQVAKELGISKERVRQIERQAMDKLQKIGADMGLEDFLHEL